MYRETRPLSVLLVAELKIRKECKDQTESLNISLVSRRSIARAIDK